MDLSKYLKKYRYFPRFTRFLFGEIGEGIRKRGFLRHEDLILIHVWKTQLWQYLRKDEIKSIGVDQSAHRIADISQKIFEIDHANPDDVTDLLKELRTLRGVGVKVASAILAVVFPDKYGVFDFHVQKALGIGGNDEYAATDAIFRMRDIAKEQDAISRVSGRRWTPREVDQALWVLSRTRAPASLELTYEEYEEEIFVCEYCGETFSSREELEEHEGEEGYDIHGHLVRTQGEKDE